MADPVDVLAFAAHPDDVEVFAGGTVATLVRQGYRVAVVDLTRGELGSRGTVEERAREARNAARILGLHARENLGLPDGDIADTSENRWRVIRAVRKYRPHLALIGAPECRHPDHVDATRLLAKAIWQAGLAQLPSLEEGAAQEPWRPAHVFHYMQHRPFEPTLVVDVSDAWEVRMEALYAFASQFPRPGSAPDGPTTFISDPAFVDSLEARAREWGFRIGVRYGEPLLYRQGPFGVTDLVSTFPGARPHR